MLIILIALFYVGFMIYLANIEQVRGESQPVLKMMQYGLVIVIAVWVFNGLVFIFVPSEQVADPELASQIQQVDSGEAVFFVGLGILAMIAIVSLIRSQVPHQWLEQYLYTESDDRLHSFDSSLSIHKLAIMLVIVQVVAVVWTYVVSGGLQGISFDYESPLEALADVAIGALLYLVCALLGVGWLVRRNLSEVCQRLSLRFPTTRDWVTGMAMAIALYSIGQIATGFWASSVPPEVLEQQTAASQQLFQAFSGSLILGFTLALITGVSEEILFRGALQPVFGLVPTSLFFTIIHIQYTLTPATVIIFVVALGFGWIRHQVSTTSAIIAHIAYNFLPFVIYTIAMNSGVL